MIKVIGVGNILSCDDGIGVRVAKELKKRFTEIEEIEVIIGETDYMYCLDNINDDDFVIIIDSTYFMIRPGIITSLNFEDCDKIIFRNCENNKSAHDESLLRILRNERRNIKGCLIGIEVDKIEFSLELSKRISKKFDLICDNVYYEILKLSNKYLKERITT